jgi:phenylalanyl-tRNA synthetase beta chain
MDLPYRDLRSALAGALPQDGTLQRLDCVDVFRHRSLPEGRQAWLLRFAFQADRTLTGEEADRWMEAALAAAQGLGAELRS